MAKQMPHSITPEGEEVYSQERPLDNERRVKAQNLREFWNSKALEKGQNKEADEITLMNDDEIMEYNEVKSQKLKRAA